MAAVARKPHRKPGHDYADFGRYFLTISSLCCRHIFWADDELECGVREDPPLLSSAGKIVRDTIQNLPNVYPGVSVDIFSIMPDHIHLIIVLFPTVERSDKAGRSIPVLVQQFKRKCSLTYGKKLWHRDYYDRVIRSDEEYGRIWNYIENNPYCMDKGNI